MPKLSRDEIRNQISKNLFYGITLDTCIFRRFDYNFCHPLLAALDQFQHIHVNVLISKIVACEVKIHIAKNAKAAQQSLNAAIEEQVKRWRLKTSRESLASKLALSDEPKDLAYRQFTQFKKAVSASIVPAVSSIESTNDLLSRYFNHQPPFGRSKDRKAEFPDAFALHSLERLAKRQKKFILCISNDNGWEQFCDESDHLVCVKELSHALSYFNESGHTAASHVIAMLQSEEKEIEYFIEHIWQEVQTLVFSLDYHADASSATHFEIDIKDVTLKDVDFSSASTPRIVKTTEKQVTFSVVIDVHVKFFTVFSTYVTESVDGDMIFLSDQLGSKEGSIETRLVITTTNDRNPSAMLIAIEFSGPMPAIDFDKVVPFSMDDATLDMFEHPFDTPSSA